MPWTAQNAAHRILENHRTVFHKRPHRFFSSCNCCEDRLRGRRQRRRRELLHRLRTEVAALGHRPFVVLLEQNRPDEPNDGLRRRKNADNVRPPLNLFVQPFERIRTVQLPLMLEWQMAVGQDVFGGVPEQRGRLRKAGTKPIGDFAQLRHGRRVVRLREDGPHYRGDRFPRALRHRRKQIAHEMHPAPLPRRAAQDRRDGLLQPFVRIGGDESNAAESAFDQTA